MCVSAPDEEKIVITLEIYVTNYMSHQSFNKRSASNNFILRTALEYRKLKSVNSEIV